MKLVAVTQRLVENVGYPETRECLDVRWGDFFASVGVMPLVLPTDFEPARYFETLPVAGVVLTGGNDLASVSPNPLNAKRDAFERRVVELATARALPIYAVCRGMQVIAEMFGSAVKPTSGHTRGVRHALQIDTSTNAGALLRGLDAVASYHDNAVIDVPAGFREIARASDGVIEAMQHERLPIHCQMWHPEREATVHPADVAVFRKLFSIQGEA